MRYDCCPHYCHLSPCTPFSLGFSGILCGHAAVCLLLCTYIRDPRVHVCPGTVISPICLSFSSTRTRRISFPPHPPFPLAIPSQSWIFDTSKQRLILVDIYPIHSVLSSCVPLVHCSPPLWGAFSPLLDRTPTLCSSPSRPLVHSSPSTPQLLSLCVGLLASLYSLLRPYHPAFPPTPFLFEGYVCAYYPPPHVLSPQGFHSYKGTVDEEFTMTHTHAQITNTPGNPLSTFSA